MRLSGFLLCGIMVWGGSVQAVKPGKNVKVYKGDEGIKVSVVSLAKPDDGKSLVKIEGLEGVMDGLVLLHEKHERDRETGLVTTVNDRSFWTLTFVSERGGFRTVMLRVPERRTKPYRLFYSEKDSEKANIAALVGEYKTQLADGSARAVQVYSGEDWKAHTNRTVREAANDAKAACGAGLGSRVEWGTVDKSLQQKHPLATMCRAPLERLTRLCSDSAAGESVKRLKGFTCKVGGGQKLAFEGGRLVWTVPSSGNIDSQKVERELAALVK